MLYCNTVTVATTRRAGTGLGAGWAGAGRVGRTRGRRRHWRGALGSVQQARGHCTDARVRAAALERAGRAGGSARGAGGGV